MHGGGRGGRSAARRPRSASCRLLRGSFLTLLPYPVITSTRCRLGRRTWAVSSVAYRPPQGLPSDYVPAYRPRRAPCEIIPFNDPSPSFPVCAHQAMANPRGVGSSAKNLRRWRKGEFFSLPTGAIPAALCMACRVWGGCPHIATTFLRLSELVALTRVFLGVRWGGFLELGGCLWCQHIGPQCGLDLR